MHAKQITPLLLGALLLNGCGSIGPRIMPVDHFHYNQSIAQIAKQELLLNIVRLRYDESAVVLKVNNISGSTNFQRGAALTANNYLAINPLYTDYLTPNLNATYTDNPIITYTPLDDQTYTTAFLKTLSIGNLNLLLESTSWSIPRVMRIGVQRAGNAHNAMSAARPTTSHVPQYKTFVDMTYVLRRMQIAEAVEVKYAQDGDDDVLVMDIDPNYPIPAKDRAILNKAGVEVYKHKILFSTKPGPHRTYIVMRSYFGILNYLSKGVQVPPQDLKNETATTTKYPNGSAFDWQNAVGGMMKIYASDTPPANAYMAVYYRNHWFYIKDNDSDSKQSFVLVSSLSGLIQNSAALNPLAPSLTRAVGQ